MKKYVLGLSLVLALSLWTLAQTSSMPATSGQTSAEQGTTGHMHHKGAAGEHEIKGCLHASGGTYTLTTAKGKTIDVMPASGVDLSEHNGHEVMLTGTWEKGEASAASTGGAKSAKAFEATKVHHISATCTAGGKEKKGGSSGMGASPKS
jgi:hypothetical protein